MRYGSAPGPTKKRPCATFSRSVGRGTNTALRPAVLAAARTYPSVPRQLQISSCLKGPSYQVFTLIGGYSWGASNKENGDGAEGIFGHAGRV